MSATSQPPAPAADPFYYGWRDVRVQRPDGSWDLDQVPLTLEDVLHPQMGDHIVESSLHELILTYLSTVFRAQLANDPMALVLSDTAIYWDILELRHHCPDIAVILGVMEQRANWDSFYVAEQGVRPRLLIEVVSQNTRSTDTVTKLAQYCRARVPVYVIVDRETKDGPALLRGYQLAGRRYLPMTPDEKGRLWLDAVGLWLGAKEDRVVCYRDDTDEEIGDYTAVSQALQEVKARAEAEKARAEAEKARAEAEKARAEAEKARAEAAETRLREMEAELARLRNGTKDEQD